MTATAVDRKARTAGVATPEAVVLQLLPPERPAVAQHILAVSFRSDAGRRWRAVGGGETLAEAIDWARECCPDERDWEVETWSELYGD